MYNLSWHLQFKFI